MLQAISSESKVRALLVTMAQITSGLVRSANLPDILGINEHEIHLHLLQCFHMSVSELKHSIQSVHIFFKRK